MPWAIRSDREGHDVMKKRRDRRSPAPGILASTLASALLVLGVAFVRAEDWPQWRGVNRDGIWKESGVLEKFAGPQLPIKWRVPVSNGYSGPTVANGRVYLTDRVVEPKEQER